MNFYYNGISVLFADDMASARENYLIYLKKLFHTVYSAENGKQAWQHYQEDKPDIMILDIQMPLISGLELARMIRENDPKTRIIIATAHHNESNLLQGIELNLTRLLPKPFGRRAFQDALAKAVGELNYFHYLPLDPTLSWDLNRRLLLANGVQINLTANERTLLSLLCSNPGQVFSYDAIEQELWPDIFVEGSNASRLKSLIKRLRKKLPQKSLENIYGEGYRLTPNP